MVSEPAPAEHPDQASSPLRSALLRAPKQAYGELYEQHRFDQYKLAVEMADRVSGRRMQANSFFLGVNTVLLTIFPTLVKEKILLGILGALPFLALVIFCFVWWRIVRSYRQLNTGKYQVILELEQQLPVAPYAAEWIALGEGKNPQLSLPLTHVENWVPSLFGALYMLLLAAVLVMRFAPGAVAMG